MVTRRQFLVGAGLVLATAAGCRMKVPTPEAQPAEPPGARPFRIALLSDTHTQDPNSIQAVAINGKLSRAVADFRPLKPDLWLCCGDVSDHGYAGELEAFRNILQTAAKPEQLAVTTGNHEFYDKEATDEVALARFREAFGLAKPYHNRVAGSVHVVMLADEQWHTAPRNREWAWLTAEQLRWFEQVLQEHREMVTVVCLHQPLQETVAWSYGGNDFAGCGQVAELKAIVKKHPQVKLWLSGHTHIPVAAEGQVVAKGGVTYAGLGSTFYQFVPSTVDEDQGGWPAAGGYRKDLSASQSRLLEVWPDRLVLRARDHASQAWIDGADVIIETV